MMNMEVEGATEEPMVLTAKSEEVNDNEMEEQVTKDIEPKINGADTDISNIHEEVDLDTLKIEQGSSEGSDSDDELKEAELKEAFQHLQNFNTQIIKKNYNETGPPKDIVKFENLEDDLEDINNEFDDDSKDDPNHDGHVSNVDSSEIINISTSLHGDSNVVNENLDNDSIDENDCSENLNEESNENSDSGVKESSEINNEKANNKELLQPKPVEKMQLRRSSRGIKRKRYDDEGPDIEEKKALPPIKIKSPNKPILPKNIINNIANIPNLYQKVLGPNTTLTPIGVKNKNLTIKPAQATPQPAILPSLTDDMFVVEAPSFIVPYVYEKPPVEPLKQFVEKLRKEVAEEKLRKEEEKKEKLELKKLEDEKFEKDEVDKASTKENGDKLGSSDTDAKVKKEDQDDEEKDEASADKEQEKNIEDESWDGYSSDSKDDDSGKEIDSNLGNKSKKLDYFDLTLGKFFTKIGLNLVKKYVQNDLLKQQNRKLVKEKKLGLVTQATQLSIVSLNKNIAASDKKCAPFEFEQQKCKFCSFKSESRMVLSHHMETPHMKNNMYKCNFCTFEVKGPHDILFHMEWQHGIRAKFERPPAYHQCSNCPFEDNGKGKLARHQIACAKRFKPNLNLAPPFEWEPPAKILTARTKTPIMNPYQYNFNRAPMIQNHVGKAIINSILPNNFRPRLRTPVPMPRANSVQGVSILRGGATIRPSIPSAAFMQNNFPSGSKPKLSNHPSISITPLPRQVQTQRQMVPPNKDGCVICEICDGYIKDLEQLRSHMQWIHRVKIHPKMMTNSPPLNCQKCQLRFFTDQGLERHLLGSHGLVTKSMQEEANKGNDGGRCPICGRVYQWKLLDHVARDHKMNLKPAHLSYKCTVCSAIFGLYKQFENHVYSAHSVVAKRVMNKGKSLPQSKIGNSILKPLRNRDDLTITPSSGRSLSSDED
ncbi:MOG interacting and ectopic P-granules protein 1 isoform X2 [Aricia agestis]|uniref:MOG interacting and ectopic P-granules protein 1 isoform X1 n=1 Tax=Aricia agestis TaxID=91739 RepID=UPI001C20989C|nr:MOG interacting and ectopic P-granules protein 1 isoform X1 [Aricia agestis]XP_041986913.1 MOG interacting and ectopic P-granules protein 1 isoform X2 [Aricia agestis]